MIRRLFATATALVFSHAVLAQSTINPLLPSNNSGLNSSVLRGSFLAAYNDINSLYKAINNGPVNIVQFGAVGDGNVSNAIVNQTALQTVINTGRCAYIPYTAAGFNFGTLRVTVGTSQCVIGENQVKLFSQSATSLFYVTSFETVRAPAIFDNLTIDMAGAPAGSTAIRHATSLAPVAGAQISRLLCLNSYECIGDEASASNYVTDEKWYDIRSVLTKGRQFFIRRSRGFMWVDTVRIDNTDPAQILPVTWDGATFNDLAGLEVRRYDMIGPTVNQTTTAQTGSTCFRVDGLGGQSPSVWLERILCDNSAGNGPEISNINYLYGTNIESFQNLGNGIALTSINTGLLTGVLGYGAVGVTGAAAGEIGFTCLTCSNLVINGLTTNFNTSHGTSLSGGSGLFINGLVANNNSGNGVVLSGTLSNLRLSGGSVASNTAGSILNSSTGTGNVIERIAGWNPVGGHAITVGASPFAYTTATSPESVCLYGGTVSTVVGPNSTQVLSSSNACIPAGPNETYTVTYSVAPTMSAIAH